MNQETLYNIILKYLQTKYPTLSLGEGSLCYDLVTPLCYMAMELYNRLDQVQQELNPVSASQEMLQVWAEPRIGKPKEATVTILYLQGTNVSFRSWIYQSSYTFNYVATISEELITVQSTYAGSIGMEVGDILTAEGDSTVQAKVTSFIQRGQDAENVEVYRTRYLQSFLVDTQAGLGAYYREKIQQHELVGITGINYLKCINGEVYVTLLNTSFTEMNAEDLQKVEYDFTTINNIVPFGQTLYLNTLGKYYFQITIQYKGTTLTEEVVRSYLEEKSRNTIIPNLMNSTQLRTSFTVADIRNDMISLFTEYGQIQSVIINTKDEPTDSFTLTEQYPVWETIIIEEV